MPDAYRKVIIMGFRKPIGMLPYVDCWGNKQYASTAFASIKLEGAEFFPTLLSHLYPDFERDLEKSIDMRQMVLDWDGFHYEPEDERKESTPDDQALNSEESEKDQSSDASQQALLQLDDSEKDQSISNSDKENTNTDTTIAAKEAENSEIHRTNGNKCSGSLLTGKKVANSNTEETPRAPAENNRIPRTNGKKCSGSLVSGKIVDNSITEDTTKASAPSKKKSKEHDAFKHLPAEVKAKVTNPLSKEVLATQDFFNKLVDQLWDWRPESLKLLADSLGLEVLHASTKKRRFRLSDRHGAMVYRVAMILTRPSDFLQIVEYDDLSNRAYK